MINNKKNSNYNKLLNIAVLSKEIGGLVRYFFVESDREVISGIEPVIKYYRDK